MTHQDKPEGAEEQKGQEVPVDTYYDEEGDAKPAFSCSWRDPGEWLREKGEKARDRVLSAIPVEVTEHLANSRREMLLAGIALAQSGIKKTDEMLERARTLHATKTT